MLCDIHPSYFSRALKGDACFSQAQIFKLSNAFNLDEGVKEYFLLLWQKEISFNNEEKKYFQNKIDLIRNEKSKLNRRLKAKELNPAESNIQLEVYYQEAITSLIHMFLTIPEFRKNPEEIVNRLPITLEKLNIELEKLEKLRLIFRKDGLITEVEENIHLPAEAKVSFINHINWRLKSIQNIEQRNPKKNDYHFSAVFSADEEAKLKVKKIILDCISQIGETVKNCKHPKDVYHLGLDLF